MKKPVIQIETLKLHFANKMMVMCALPDFYDCSNN